MIVNVGSKYFGDICFKYFVVIVYVFLFYDESFLEKNIVWFDCKY